MAGFAVPPGATDCHMHVFGDPAAYPPAAHRAYDPRTMGWEVYDGEAARMGFSRVVVVQPSAYGTDNRCTLDAIRGRANTRGVAVIDAATSDAALDEMAGLGVRGVRLNLVSNGEPDPAQASAQLLATQAQVARLGWHIQIFALPALIAGIAPTLHAMRVPVVIDLMGAGDGLLDAPRPGFSDILDLLAAGRCWVKISGANRVSRGIEGFADALPVMRALVAANPARALWGTDWPHIGPHVPGKPEPVQYMPLDNLALLRLLGEAIPDAATRERILVDNPAALYGF